MNLFGHANGFPPDSYSEFFSALEAPLHSVKLSPLKRPFNQEEQKKNWHHFGDEFIFDLEKLINKKNDSSKILGIGHSMGAIMLLRAACLRPELFERLILMDPTFLPEPFVWISNYLPRFINRKIHPVGSKAYRRRDSWPSKESAFDSFRRKKLFRSLSDQALWNYVNAVMISRDDGTVTLGYSKAWEEHCFLSVINIWPLVKKCPVPVVGITGRHSELMRPSIIERWKKLAPETEIHTLEKSGHLVPLERPKECAEIINSYL